MPKIALSYRRSDSAANAGRIFDRLALKYGAGSVFMDIDTIPFGVDFRNYISDALTDTDVLIVVVGPKWIGPVEGGPSRMNDDDDPVRVEVEAALRNGIPVIPVLVERAQMPKPGDLPESLRSFPFLNAAEVDSGRDFHAHMERLIRFVDGLIDQKKATAEEPVRAEVSAEAAARPVEPVHDTPPGARRTTSADRDLLLETQALHARYGQIEAIHGIDISVERGAIVALLGANGAGKTSTLRAITGTIKTEGTVLFDGVPIQQRTPEDAARLGIAHVPEGRGTLSALTVWENLTLGAYTKSAKHAQERYARVVVYFPWLEERKRQTAGTLSGGEQQMLAIARALMMQPQLMLLDEPSLGLAPIIVRQIFDLLRTINKEDGVSILVAEQNATVALAAADHAYVLEAGCVAVHGPGDELMRDDRVRRSYLGY